MFISLRKYFHWLRFFRGDYLALECKDIVPWGRNCLNWLTVVIYNLLKRILFNTYVNCSIEGDDARGAVNPEIATLVFTQSVKFVSNNRVVAVVYVRGRDAHNFGTRP
jgi:hypothetical protein